MKSSIRKRTYEAIYRLLDRVSPLDYDCGRLCNSICCTAEDGRELGIYLLPGEEKVHSRGDEWLEWVREDAEDYDFPDSWKGKVYFVKCKTPPICPRNRRPIQCRTFPLVPHINEDGELSLVYNDLDLPYRCPLIEDEIPLNDDFVQATFTAWKHLVEDPLIYDLVRQDSQERENALSDLWEILG